MGPRRLQRRRPPAPGSASQRSASRTVQTFLRVLVRSLPCCTVSPLPCVLCPQSAEKSLAACLRLPHFRCLQTWITAPLSLPFPRLNSPGSPPPFPHRELLPAPDIPVPSAGLSPGDVCLFYPGSPEPDAALQVRPEQGRAEGRITSLPCRPRRRYRSPASRRPLGHRGHDSPSSLGARGDLRIPELPALAARTAASPLGWPDGVPARSPQRLRPLAPGRRLGPAAATVRTAVLMGGSGSRER